MEAKAVWSASFHTNDEHGNLIEVPFGATFAMLHDEQGRYVADVHGLVEDGPGEKPLRERAALIVRAVNNHDRLEEINAKLVEALEAINADQSLYDAWAMEARISGDEFNRRAKLIFGMRAALAAAKTAAMTDDDLATRA